MRRTDSEGDGIIEKKKRIDMCTNSNMVMSEATVGRRNRY